MLEKNFDTQETVERHHSDLRLRRHGFQIISRPKRGPVLWGKAGKTYTEAEADLWVDAQEMVVIR